MFINVAEGLATRGADGYSLIMSTLTLVTHHFCAVHTAGMPATVTPTRKTAAQKKFRELPPA